MSWRAAWRLSAWLTVAALLGTSACSNDFDLTDNWKEIPVVYGILKAGDTAHYVRVEKGFIDPTRSALDIARIPDSLYYPDSKVAVYIVRVRDTRQKFRLVRVDGNKEGFQRQDGIFATQPNWLYKLRRGLADSVKAGEAYRLLIERTDGKPAITAETTVPREMRVVSPNPADIPPMITFREGNTTRVEWRSDVNAVFHNVTLLIRYREEDATGAVVARRSLTWQAGRNIRRSETLVDQTQGLYRGTLEINSDLFFDFLRSNIPAATSGRVRYFEPWDIIIEGGGKEIEQLLETTSANAGLTGAEVINNYTNLSEGFGIFTAKATRTMINLRPTSQTITAVQSNALTRELNFKN